MRYRVLFPVMLLFGILVAGPAVRSVAADELCFPDQPGITACLEDSFARYWEVNGGLPVLGYPITDTQPMPQPDQPGDIMIQWTERARLEAHPQNAAPYDILLGRLGEERLAQLGRVPAQEGRESGPQSDCLWFEETGHNVCDQVPGQGFKTYWESHGLNVAGLDAYNRSLQLFGLPLTAIQMETNADGATVMTQWFERARFEWHPDNPDDFKVLLGLLGSEVHGRPENSPGGISQPAADPSVFGVQINRGKVAATASRLREANISWVRYGNISWAEVEATPGVRDWSRLEGVEAELRAIIAAGGTPVVIIYGTPDWAQKVPGAGCGPIHPDALDNFAGFMSELVSRYSGPPYNVRYWELGNEPDVDPSLVSGDSPFGCWGDENDPYYGGGYYAEMLKQVYPAIKQANPAAQVVTGGVLLNCDPDNPPSGKDCKPARFVEGILQNGGGEAFDILAYHAYTYWGAADQDWDRAHPAWQQRGGLLLGKLDFLRSVLSQYGVDKPIFMNEGGLLCYPSGTACVETDPGFYNDQANYAVRLYTRAWANNLMGVAWYTLNGPGWREGGLLDAAQAPRPAYQTVQFMAQLLAGADYSGPLSNGALEGYAFQKDGTAYHVYWTNDSATVELPLPPDTRAAYSYLGQPVPLPDGTLTVGFEPVFLEIGP